MKHSTDIAQARKRTKARMRANLVGLMPGTLYLWTYVMEEANVAAVAAHLSAILSPDELEQSLRLHRAAAFEREFVKIALVRILRDASFAQ